MLAKVIMSTEVFQFPVSAPFKAAENGVNTAVGAAKNGVNAALKAAERSVDATFQFTSDVVQKIANFVIGAGNFTSGQINDIVEKIRAFRDKTLPSTDDTTRGTTVSGDEAKKLLDNLMKIDKLEDAVSDLNEKVAIQAEELGEPEDVVLNAGILQGVLMYKYVKALFDGEITFEKGLHALHSFVPSADKERLKRLIRAQQTRAKTMKTPEDKHASIVSTCQLIVNMNK